MTPEERAKRTAEVMWAEDNSSKWFGMELESIGEGCATMTLTICEHHLNGHGVCHGGVTFALADSAFAFACNSRNQVTVAQHNVISYISSGRLGDRLSAHATEISLTGRNGITDVQVTNQSGTLIAEFRGMSRAINGTVFDEA